MRKQAIVFCIHGNKYGFAKCCEELKQTDKDSTPLLEGTDNMANAYQSTPVPIQPHCHTYREGGVDVKARRKLIIASVFCIIFIIAEAVGGILANSLAIATDAAHLLTDFASFMISLFSIWVAGRPATKRMSFGWHRAEVIGATISVLLIWVVTGILVYMAVQRIVYMDFEIDHNIMLITSGIGVLMNIIMGCSLHQHSHGHSHSNDEENPGERENINVRAAYIHVIGDFIQSIGVFIAALIVFFKPEWRIVDPICTFIFSILVLFTTIKILRDTINVLMEGIPNNVNFNVVQDTFLSVEGIQSVHNLRIWGITTDKTALSAHLAITPGSNAQTILKDASVKIRQKYNFYEMTLQVEDFDQDMEDCQQCQNPES